MDRSRRQRIWKRFLNRDLPSDRSRRVAAYLREIDALVSAPRAKLGKLVARYLRGGWSTQSRGMAGHRASFLAVGLAARAGGLAALAPDLEKYVARSLLRDAPRASAKPTKVTVPSPPPFQGPLAGSAPRARRRAHSAIDDAVIVNDASSVAFSASPALDEHRGY